MSMSSDSGVSSLSTSPPLSSSLPVQGQRRRQRSKRRLCSSNSTPSFQDVYTLSGQVLGEGAYGCVQTCFNLFTDAEYAVKRIDKTGPNYMRSKVLKEIELYYLCQRQENVIQMIEYFEESQCFYLVFEKAFGGPLLSHIQERIQKIESGVHDQSADSLNHDPYTEKTAVGCGLKRPLFDEGEAKLLLRHVCTALAFLHDKGIAHRDLKPENILCMAKDHLLPVKLSDFDLCSNVQTELTNPNLQSPVGSAEYMAPEVVTVFEEDCYNQDYDGYLNDEVIRAWSTEQVATYDKKCDLWSLGVLLYLLLCGHLPFQSGNKCEEGCAWNEGGECNECQRSLFNAIVNDQPVFPSFLPTKAKDLLMRLLQKDPRARISIEDVLNHPWINDINDNKHEHSEQQKAPPNCDTMNKTEPFDSFKHLLFPWECEMQQQYYKPLVNSNSDINGCNSN